MEREYAEEIRHIVTKAHDVGMRVKLMLEFGYLTRGGRVTVLSYESGV